MASFGHAIITGGSSGIGKAVAHLLARRGMRITLIARDKKKLSNAIGEIEASRCSAEQTIQGRPADVAERGEISTAVQTAIETSGAPSLLITSAGMAQPGYFHELPPEVFEQTMSVNYLGTLYAIRAALPAMRENGSGRIVMVSSGAGLVGIYGYTAYSPSKFALRGLAESLRGELRFDNIGVSIVYPPDTDTPQLTEENRTKPLETKAITGSAKTWSADGVAKKILHGIDRKRFSISPGWEMSLLSRFHSVIAPALQWYFDRLSTRARKASDRATAIAHSA